MVRVPKGYSNLPKPYDEIFEMYSSHGIPQYINKYKDDYLTIITGSEGYGKSTLGFHMMDLFLKDKSDPNYMCQDWTHFVKKMDLVVNKEKHPKFVCYDEAGDVDNRSTQSKKNKAVIRFYKKIRHARVFHLWITPDIKTDKDIYKRLDCWIHIYNRSGNFRYYYLVLEPLLKVMLKKSDGKLTFDVLDQYKNHRYMIKGWFKKKEGKDWDYYDSKIKDDSMRQAVEELKRAVPLDELEDKITLKDVAREMGVAKITVQHYLMRYLQENPDQDVFKKKPNGQWKYTMEAIEELKRIQASPRKSGPKQTKNTNQ